MTQVLYAQSARSDLLEAWLFIAEENMSAADRVLEAIEHEAATLSLQPKMGRARPELGKDVRSWPTSTPYVLFYQLSLSGLTVLRVLHHARDVGQQIF